MSASEYRELCSSKIEISNAGIYRIARNPEKNTLNWFNNVITPPSQK